MVIKPGPLPDYGNHPIAANWVKCSPIRNKLGGGDFVGAGPCMVGGAGGARRSSSSKKTKKEKKTKKCTGNCKKKFDNFKDHYERHGKKSGMTPEQYRNAAETHSRPKGSQWKGKLRHDGKTKMGHISRLGPNKYTFTSTTPGGGRIFTHMSEGVSSNYLRNIGITLPKDLRP